MDAGIARGRARENSLHGLQGTESEDFALVDRGSQRAVLPRRRGASVNREGIRTPVSMVKCGESSCQVMIWRPASRASSRAWAYSDRLKGRDRSRCSRAL